jgi:outer membrane PBP1 activator LpoA protein
MLHARRCGRQVHGWLLAALLAAAAGAFLPAPAHGARAEDVATADALALSGRHAEAAQLYESLAKRPFRSWDTRLTLLSAREYLAAGQLDDAERLLGRVRGAVRGDDAALMARVQAEVALARGRPTEAIAALAAVPEPWPAPLAAELLGLRGRAEFAAGRTLEAVRTFEARAKVLGTATERRENYSLLIDGLVERPAALASLPANASPSERGWLELGQLLAAPPGDPIAAARRVMDWRARYPTHPGTEFLPQGRTTAAELGAATLSALGSADRVALLLPLSGRQQSAGVAVRDGFLAAALAEPPGRRPQVEIFDTAALGAAAAYQKALATGARAVAGPLTKEEVAAMAGTAPLPVPTLALNTVPGDAPLFLFQFALDPEQEARAAARRIARDGHVRGIALFPRSAWGERVRSAFAAETLAVGVQLTAVEFYEPEARDHSGPLRSALGRFAGAGDRGGKGEPPRRDAATEARDGPQFAFMAASSPVARALKPQLRFQMSYDMPVYATSDAWEAGARAAPDLEGLLFPEMPWILHGGAGAPLLWDALHGEWAGGRSRLRLYAFGYDAFQLLRGLASAARGTGMNGLTGHLDIGPDGRVARELEWARVQDGREQPADDLLPAVPTGSVP